MDRLPYSRLSEHYDAGWGDFAESCQRFIAITLRDYGIEAGYILELACGTGILAVHLAQTGHVVLGVDQSPEMVAIASERASAVEGVDFRIGDMSHYTPEDQFDAALCMFDSLNYLTTLDEVSAMLTSVSASLNPGGIFVFDFNRPLIYLAHNGEMVRMRVSHGILSQQMHYEVPTRIARTRFRFPDGDVETHVQRAYEMREIEPLLAASHFNLNACYSDFARRSVSPVSERLICVCQKA